MMRQRSRTATGRTEHDDDLISNADLAEAFLGTVGPKPRKPASALWPSLFGALVIGAVAWGAAELAIDQRKAELSEAERLQAETLAQANAALISGRIAGLSQLARRITGSELVRVWAAGAANDDGLSPWLTDQAPFLRQTFEDFVTQHGLLAASLLAADGTVLLTVGELAQPPALPERPGNGIDPTVTPIYELTGGAPRATIPGFDIVLPIAGPAELAEARSAPAHLVMTLNAATTFARALEPATSGAPVISQSGGQDIRLPLAEGSPSAAHPVVRTRVKGTPWLIEQPVVSLVTEERLAVFERDALVFAGLVALLLTFVFGVFCGVLARRRRREQELAEQASIAQAKRFSAMFESLAEQVSDGVGLKSSDGRYVYANDALGQRLGRRANATLRTAGHESGAAAGHGAEAETASSPDRSLVRSSESVPSLVVVPAPVPQIDGPGTVGSVPMTPVGHFTVDQAIGLLVRAVELRDPFLSGHAGRVAELAGAVAVKMGLSEAERVTIELTARLSQIGKIFIPDAILTKPGRHTDEEARIMRSHVDRALDLLGRIDVGLPVAFLLAQMHERLDGSGYPRGLSGDEITLSGRLLGAVDVFCARTAPRAYREQVSAGQALFDLAADSGRFDARVVTALVAVFAEMRREAPALSAPDQAHAA